eukprot:6191456-Pleurochrysis_carterae.AAC.1
MFAVRRTIEQAGNQVKDQASRQAIRPPPTSSSFWKRSTEKQPKGMLQAQAAEGTPAAAASPPDQTFSKCAAGAVAHRHQQRRRGRGGIGVNKVRSHVHVVQSCCVLTHSPTAIDARSHYVLTNFPVMY